MSSLRPVAVYGITVPAGDEPVPAFDPGEYPATFKLTMAALDPFEKPEEMDGEETPFKGATLRIIRIPTDDSDDEDSDDDDSYDMASLLDGVSSGDESEDEAASGGSSDPEKALRMKLLKEAIGASSDSMDVDVKSPKGKGKGKGKKAQEPEEEEEDEEDLEDSDEDDEDFDGPEEFVLCTLDPTKNYQQTLDITISEHERVYFQVTGTHSVYLTGNILIPENEDMYDSEDDEDDEDDYDLTPDEEELGLLDDEDESDELDDLDDSRVTDVTDEDAEAPKLVESKKGKNKRAAPDSEGESMTIDDLVEKSLKSAPAAETNGETKLSKKQKKKLKANSGAAVDAPATPAAEDAGTKVEDTKPSPGKSDKKVQFAKPITQGPTGTTPEAKTKNEAKTNGDKPAKAAAGPKVVQGVTIDDKKLGSGPAAKKGDKVSMRYIGKLEKDKKVFDSNKKGKPFTFALGKGEVIKGWDIGVAGMAVGGERRITIPAHLAYGSKKQEGIPANSTLVFDLKVLEIK